MKIVSSVGSVGSGKDTVMKYIADKYHFTLISMGDIVREIAERNGIVPDRDNLHRLSDEYFRLHGKDYFIRKVIRKIETEKLGKVAITGIRTPTDASALKKRFGKAFVLILVDIPNPRKRFERLRKRNEPRDPETWEGFLKQDQEEEEIFSLGKTFSLADYKILNDDGLQELFEKVDAIMERELRHEP